jgi:hypothetical protein
MSILAHGLAMAGTGPARYVQQQTRRQRKAMSCAVSVPTRVVRITEDLREGTLRVAPIQRSAGKTGGCDLNPLHL